MRMWTVRWIKLGLTSELSGAARLAAIVGVRDEEGMMWGCSEAKEGDGVAGAGFIANRGGGDSGQAGRALRVVAAWTVGRFWHCGRARWQRISDTGVVVSHWSRQHALARVAGMRRRVKQLEATTLARRGWTTGAMLAGAAA